MVFINDVLKGHDIAERKLNNCIPLFGSPNWLVSLNLKRAEIWAKKRCEILNKMFV